MDTFSMQCLLLKTPKSVILGKKTGLALYISVSHAGV